jgi:hypothetical protein
VGPIVRGRLYVTFTLRHLPIRFANEHNRQINRPPDLISTKEVGELLGVTAQQVRRLAETGAIDRVARGLIDRQSVERYLACGRGGRTRVWAEPTAWGVIALLSGQPAEWLTSTQTSRIRATLRTMHDPRELATRLRNRATATTYVGDSTAEHLIKERLSDPDMLGPMLVGTQADGLDGYIAADAFPRIARILELRPDPAGTITLRVTSFAMTRVHHLSGASPVLAALDVATSLDPAQRAVGERLLGWHLDSYQSQNVKSTGSRDSAQRRSARNSSGP